MEKFKILERIGKGEKVYLIDEYDETAVCYFPDNNGMVYSKGKNCRPVLCPMTNKYIFESTLDGKECTKADFENY